MRIEERYRVQRRDGKIVSSVDGEHWTEVPLGTLVSMNMWGFTPGIFPELEARFPRFLRQHERDIETAEFLLPEVVGEMVGEGVLKVRVIVTEARWFGITYPKDVEEARAEIRGLIEGGAYPRELWGGEASPG